MKMILIGLPIVVVSIIGIYSCYKKACFDANQKQISQFLLVVTRLLTGFTSFYFWIAFLLIGLVTIAGGLFPAVLFGCRPGNHSIARANEFTEETKKTLVAFVEANKNQRSSL